MPPLHITGLIDAARLAVAFLIDAGEHDRAAELEKILEQLTRAADIAEDAGV